VREYRRSRKSMSKVVDVVEAEMMNKTVRAFCDREDTTCLVSDRAEKEVLVYY